MLRLRSRPFTSGRSLFVDHVPGSPDRTAKVYVKIGFDGLDSTVFAQIDTGAAWSILPPDSIRIALDPQANDFYFGPC